MPHRVATFFRSHSSNTDTPNDLKKSFKRSSSRKPSAPGSSSSASSISSDDHSVKMPDNADKRLSLAAMHSPKASATKIPQHQTATLDYVIESPPLVFYGPIDSSTGALLSGQIVLKIHEDALPIESFKMQLGIEVTRKKPFHTHCPDCSKQTTVLKDWQILQGAATWRRGEHPTPFSHLLSGHLPATTRGSLTTIEYVLRATVLPKGGEPIKLSHTLDVKRSILPNETPRNSIRIFPPTNLTANVTLPSVIHPIGSTVVTMRVDGCVKRNLDGKSQHQWRLKRLTWRLDETQKTISPACAKHLAKMGTAIDEEKKGVAHQDVRTVGSEEMKSGWKADYSTPDGSIELEFPIGVRADARPTCDMKAEDGTDISHQLVVEMIVAEEYCPIKRPNAITPTGSARVLRMHFNMIVTERSGLGISWDEEQPPVYEDVPASPPRYLNAEIYDEHPIPGYADLMPLDGVSNTTPLISTPVQGNGEGSSARPSSSSGIPLGRLSLEDFQLDRA